MILSLVKINFDDASHPEVQRGLQLKRKESVALAFVFFPRWGNCALERVVTKPAIGATGQELRRAMPRDLEAETKCRLLNLALQTGHRIKPC